jgi:hypothetical protein
MTRGALTFLALNLARLSIQSGPDLLDRQLRQSPNNIPRGSLLKYVTPERDSLETKNVQRLR